MTTEETPTPWQNPLSPPNHHRKNRISKVVEGPRPIKNRSINPWLTTHNPLARRKESLPRITFHLRRRRNRYLSTPSINKYHGTNVTRGTRRTQGNGTKFRAGAHTNPRRNNGNILRTKGRALPGLGQRHLLRSTRLNQHQTRGPKLKYEILIRMGNNRIRRRPILRPLQHLHR